MASPQLLLSKSFPSWKQAPADLANLEGNCGPLSMWMVASALGRDLHATTIIRACRLIPCEGMWPMRLALAFDELGFKVEYRGHSVRQHDSSLSAEAKSKGLAILPPMSLLELLESAGITIICYDVITGGGHFTPILKMRDGSVYLPLDYDASVQAIEIVERQRKQADLETITVYS